jgi:LysM repeat protein
MRPRTCLRFVPVLALGLFQAGLAGCTSSGSVSVAPISTGSLSDRPSERMVRDEQSRVSSGYGRQYVDPGTPTPRQYSNSNYAYGQNVETGSLGSESSARWQQTPPSRWSQPSAPQAPAGRTVQTSYEPDIIEVRDGDTLYALSRRYNVPVSDLMAANRLSSERIAIGQRLVIPTRYR